MKKKLLVTSILIFTICASCLIVYVSANNIAAFIINGSPGYRVSYASWKGNVLAKSTLKDVKIQLIDRGIVVNSENVDLRSVWSDFKKNAAFALECKMEGITVFPMNSKSYQQGTDNSSKKQITDFLFDSDQKYDTVIFTVAVSSKEFKLIGFKASSNNIRVEGNYTHFNSNNDIDIDVKVSFSPEMSQTFEENIRGYVLSPDDDGWYSTIISYKGNPVLLQAIYSFL